MTRPEVMTRPAVMAIARREWNRHRAALLAIGVVAGLFGGAVVAGASLARRSSTAPERLLAATALGDAHVRIFDPELTEAIAALPMVADVAPHAVAVGRVAGTDAVRYVGVLAPAAPDGRLVRPVIVRGRAAAPDDPTEVVVIEDVAGVEGFGIGEVVELAMLTPAELSQFDTGFGEPDGPTLRLRITGVARVPPASFGGTPVLATPAFAATHQELASGVDLAVSLQRGRRDFVAFSAAVEQLVASRAEPSPDDDFAAATVTDPSEGTRAFQRSSRVLVGGLLAAVGAAAAAVVVALGQAWSRHHDDAAHVQQIERALGLTSVERVAARAIPAAVSGSVAACVALVVALAGGRLEPPGAIGTVESQPGWRPDVAVALIGAALLALTIATAGAATAWAAGRHGAGEVTTVRARVARAVPHRYGWLLVGSAFARAGSGNGRTPRRTSLWAVVLGVGAVVGALTFSASLGRLAADPVRYGWTSDLVVADATEGAMAELDADPRVDALIDGTSANVRIEGRHVDAYAYRARRGAISWHLLEGRSPGAVDEIVAGTKLAERLGVEVGDELRVGEPATAATFRVVGIGIGPPINGEGFAQHALLTADGLERAGAVGAFREAFVRLAPGTDLDRYAADLGARYEVTPRSEPPEVRDVLDLGALPSLLGGFLALVAVVAHAHGLGRTVRDRRAELAVLRALGSTVRDVRLTVLTTSLTLAARGVALGTPLGWATGRFVWGRVASALGVATAVSTPWSIVVAVIGAFGVAALVAAVPAFRAGRDSPMAALRHE